MPTYYVRTDGNNSNDGLSPGAAKLTIQAAVNLAVAGDTIYVAPGTYREMVTLASSGSSGSPITLEADVTGEHTGDDAGLVIITGHDTDTSGAARANGIYTANRTWWTIRGFTLAGFTGDAILLGDGSTANSFEGMTIEQCAVSNRNGAAINLRYVAGSTPSVQGARIRDCVLFSFRGNNTLVLTHENNSTANVPVDLLVERCLIWSVNTGNAGAVATVTTGTNLTNSISGITFKQCTVFGSQYGFYLTRIKQTGAVVIEGSLTIGGGSTANAALQTDNNAITFNWNIASGTQSTGPYNQSNVLTDGLMGMFGGLADYPLRRALGWSPYLPWEPISPNAVIDRASLPDYGSQDMYGNRRPMRRGRDAGAVEARQLPRQETGVTHEGDNAIRFGGAGYHDFFIPVSAAAKTVTVQARRDSNYTGDNPILRVLNIPGVADQSDAMTGSADAWEELACSFTPSAAGVVRVRIESRDTSASGIAYFDSLDVS